MFRDLSELTSNHKYQVGDQAPSPATEAVVVGRVTDVRPGRAFTVPGGDAPGGTLTDFDDRDAQWRTFHLTVDITETISGAVKADPPTVGLAFGPSTQLETVRKDLTAMGEMVFFLNRTPVFGYDDTVYGTVADGALLAPVDSSGRLSLPALSADESRDLLRQGSTVTELRTAAKEPDVVLRFDPTGAVRLPD